MLAEVDVAATLDAALVMGERITTGEHPAVATES
jgi:hypothetical protein